MKIIGEDEEIDFNLNFDRKKFIKKMLIFGTIAIFVIVCSSIAGIHVAKSYNNHLISKYYATNQNNPKDNKNSSIESNEKSRNIQGVKEENTLAEESIKKNPAQNQKENQDDQNKQENQGQIQDKPKLPVYSDEAQKRVNDIYNSDGGEKIAYLTFDDGPSSKITPQILQILNEENIKATFFVLRK